VGGWQHHALKGGGVRRALAGVELVVEQPLVDLVADVDQGVPVGGGEQAADPEVAGVVDGGLVRSARPSLKYCLTLLAR
jgi:hypothetical protein